MAANLTRVELAIDQVSTWNTDTRSNDLAASFLARCQVDIVCMQECQYTNTHDCHSCGCDVRFSTCNRAAVFFSGGMGGKRHAVVRRG
eukprot:628041-Pyramimonas_sp.AAC.1